MVECKQIVLGRGEPHPQTCRKCGIDEKCLQSDAPSAPAEVNFLPEGHSYHEVGPVTVYIAGPMRGKPFFNFPAFDEAKAKLESEGFRVVSPADLDRQAGFDPELLGSYYDWHDLNKCGFSLMDAIERDVEALKKCSGIFMLSGWEASKGAKAEKALAEWMGLSVLYQDDADPREDEEDVLEEALRITKGDRNASYGPPDQDFKRTALMWSAMKGVHFEPREVAMFMIALKLSRETHQCKRDNWTDIAGYARCGSLCKT
ncbi:MAG: DUF6378 domain-containing protein [Planctomycetota bacterium]